VLPLETALAKAQEFGLDLVEVSPMAKPPVCKIMDYGKFKYEAKKKASEAKKKQTVVKLKEVKFRPKTEEHDYNFKTRAIREFLAEGNKARVTVMFRGREITHREIGQNILRRIETELKDIAVVEQPSRMEGRLLFMILAPNPRFLQQQRQQQQPQAGGGQAQRSGQPSGPRPVAAQARPPSAARPAAPTNGAPRPATASASTTTPPPQRAEAPKA
jgi:translation initiation factor IF-3